MKHRQLTANRLAYLFEMCPAIQHLALEDRLIDDADGAKVAQGGQYVSHVDVVAELQEGTGWAYWFAAVDAQDSLGVGYREPGEAVGTAEVAMGPGCG